MQNKPTTFLRNIKAKLIDKTEDAPDKMAEDDKLSTYIKNLKNKTKEAFKQKKFLEWTTEEDKEQNKNAELNIDFTSAKEFLIKHSTILFIAIILLLQFMPNEGYLPWGGMWMRLQTEKLPVLDDFARDTVNNFYKNQIAQSITQQYPNLPGENLNQLIDEQLQKIITENQQQIQEQTTQTAEYLKDSMRYEINGTKYTLMPDIDPYQYMRLAQNYVDHGRLGDTEKDGKSWDTKVLAPIGRDSIDDRELQPYVLAYIYKIARFFKPEIPLMQTSAYFPIIFVTLASIFAFLFVRKLTNNTGGLFAATMLTLSTSAAGRTQWGHADTDAYNLFFPMLISWLFIESLMMQNKTKKYLLILLNSFFLGAYAFAWVGWWYIFDFILAALGIQIIYTILFNRQKTKEAITTFATYFIATAVFYSAFRRWYLSNFIIDVLGPFNFGLLKVAAHSNPDNFLFPNVYTTVAELNPTNWAGAINSAGGQLFIIISIIGIILLLTKKSLPLRDRTTYAGLLTIWLIATTYATTKGIRFSILMSPTIAVMFGVAAGMAQEKMQQFNKETLRIKKGIPQIIVIIIFALIIMMSGQVESSWSQSKNDLPIMNKAWWNTLTKIKAESQPNAIINSWWDFGHHFKYVADRAVTFDGAHQNSPMAHWIGKVLSTNDEEEAIAILRMLDCGSRKAYDGIANVTNNDALKAVKILDKTIKIKNKQEAKKYLEKQGIKEPDKILQYTHCEPPENYFITSEDMTSKAGVWSHFGNWNFERAYAWINLRNKDKDTAVQEMTNKLNYSKEQAEQTYFDMQTLKDEGAANTWISGWAGYASGFDGCTANNETIQCGNGATINTLAEQNSSGHRKGETTMDATIRFDQGTAKPRYLSYIDEKTLKFTVKEFNQSPASFAIILVPSGDSYKSILASPEHADSIYTRLFYMEGHGLKHFKQFDKQNSRISGGQIITWKIDWQGTEPNVIESLK